MAPVPITPFDNTREFAAFATVAIVLVVACLALLIVSRWQDSAYHWSCSVISDIRSRFSSMTCAQSSGLPTHIKSPEMAQIAAGSVAAFVLFPGLSIACGVISSSSLAVPSVIRTPRPSFQPTLASIEEEDEDAIEEEVLPTAVYSVEEQVEEDTKETYETFIVPVEAHASVEDDVFSSQNDLATTFVSWTIPHHAAALWSIPEDEDDEHYAPRLSQEEKGKYRAQLDTSGEFALSDASSCTATPTNTHTPVGYSPSTPTSSRRHRETRSYWSPDTPVTPPQPSFVSNLLRSRTPSATTSVASLSREGIKKLSVLRVVKVGAGNVQVEHEKENTPVDAATTTPQGKGSLHKQCTPVRSSPLSPSTPTSSRRHRMTQSCWSPDTPPLPKEHGVFGRFPRTPTASNIRASCRVR